MVVSVNCQLSTVAVSAFGWRLDTGDWRLTKTVSSAFPFPAALFPAAVDPGIGSGDR